MFTKMKGERTNNMPYSSNEELPSGVKNSLPSSAQSTWRKVFNEAYKEYKDDSKASQVAWSGLKNAGWTKDGDKWVKKEYKIEKYDDDNQIIFGWANVTIRKDGEQIKDSDEHLMDTEDLEMAAYAFNLSYRELGESHMLKNKGHLVESMMFTKEKMKALNIPEGTIPEGLWVGFYVPDKDLYMKVKKGDYKMFSIEGLGKLEEVE